MGSAMYFSYPSFLESTPELGFADAVGRLGSVATLVNRVKRTGIDRLTYQDCKEVVPLYVAAQNELERVDETKSRAQAYRVQPRIRWDSQVKTDGCWVLMSCVHATFVEPYRAAKRYIYIPFNSNTAELMGWAKKWQAYYQAKQKRFEIICGSDSFAKIPLLSQIYILGHGSAGSDTIFPQQREMNKLNHVSFDVLANKMELAKLSKEFWGKIKVYACQGGADLVEEDLVKKQSFTTKFAKSMRERKGYVNCEYFGYTVSLAAPVTFEPFEGRLTSTLDLGDEKQLVRMAGGSNTIKDKLFSPAFMAQYNQFSSHEAKKAFLRNQLMIWVSMEKETKPSQVRRQF
jgi:hypothetical protein